MLKNTNLVGLASADSSGPIYLPEDVYVGVWGGPGTTTINLPAGTRAVVFATGPTSKANLNVTSITLGGVGATKLVETYQTEEYYKGSGVWAVNYAGSGPTTVSFTCGSGAVIMAFALKRQFASLTPSDTAIDVTPGGANQPFVVNLDVHKDGLVVCAWRTYIWPASIGAPFTSWYNQHTSWASSPLSGAIVVPTATELNKQIVAYADGDGGACCDDGATLSIVSFAADKFI